MEVSLPLWRDPAEGPFPRFPRLERDSAADVVVLGLGMTGASAAYHAAARGLRVVAVDAGEVAGGASGRNAGFLLGGPEAHYSDAVQARGRAFARELWTLNRANRDAVIALVEKLAIDCGLERSGSLVAAIDEDEARRTEADAELLRADGFPCELLDARETDARVGGAGFERGLFVPDDANLQPVKFVAGLAEAAARAGASVHERTPVRALRKDGGTWRVDLEGGVTVSAPVVACGLNAYAPSLLAWARDRVFPVRGQVLATEPSPQAPKLPVYADRGYLYARAYKGRAVVGGLRHLRREEEVGVEDALNPALQRGLEGVLLARWGMEPRVTHRWSGTMGFSRDGLPWIGAVPESSGLLVAFGYTGHGWGYGVRAGAWLAEAAAGGKPAIPPWLDAARPLTAERTAF